MAARWHQLMPKVMPRHMPPDITTAAKAPPGSAPSTLAKRNGYLKDPARFRSLDFGERNGYLKNPARFRSLDFSEHNEYLKGVAPIDAQQKSMELLTFSCSRGSSWVGALLPRYGHHG